MQGIRRNPPRLVARHEPVADRSAHLDFLAPLPAELVKTPGN